ncbi:MAG: hypothetical protein GEU93_22385 [Propionibacteriales bacterium]|nr:hypothetical protein [Propionibacteriales bacterium]
MTGERAWFDGMSDEEIVRHAEEAHRRSMERDKDLPPITRYNRAKWEDDWVPQVVGFMLPTYPGDRVVVRDLENEREHVVNLVGLHPGPGGSDEFYQLEDPQDARRSWFLKKKHGNPAWSAGIDYDDEAEQVDDNSVLAHAWTDDRREPGTPYQPPRSDPDREVRVRRYLPDSDRRGRPARD